MPALKKRVYVETTVVSYFTAKSSRDLIVAGHQQTTHKLWPKFSAQYETFVSALVYQEAGRGDREQARHRLAAIAGYSMLAIDDESRALAEKIVAEHGVP